MLARPSRVGTIHITPVTVHCGSDPSCDLHPSEPSPSHVVTEDPAPSHVVTEDPAPRHVVTEDPAPSHVVTEDPAPSYMPATAAGARLALTVLVLVPLVQTSHHSPTKHHSANIVRLLSTPVHQLDDAAIWEVASFLSNYTSLPPEDNDDALDANIRMYVSSSDVPESRVDPQKSVPAKPKKHKHDHLQLTIEKVQIDNGAGHKTYPHKTTTKRPYPDPSGLGSKQKRASSWLAQRSPRSAGDQFYFLHHLRPDLPALDRVMAEEPPEEDEEEEEEPSTPAPPPRRQPAASADQRLQTLLRAMVVYGEAAEGDEGTLSAVRQLADEGVARVELPKPRKALTRLVEDLSILKTRRRRAAFRPDMTKFTDFMGRERYSQELINSFQPGGKRHLSIKKELREPIDVDLNGVAVMSASLRKRSAPERDLPSAGPEELLPADDIDGVGVAPGQRTRRGLAADTSATYTLHGAATWLAGARARRRRSAGGTRRVLDDIRIAPDLPDLMELDPEDVLESDPSPLLPVLVSSGAEDPLAVTERPALVFEDTGQRETWSAWGRWGPCSVTCGPGQKARYRHCVQGPRCQPGERESDFKPCFRKSCTLPIPDGLVDAYR